MWGASWSIYLSEYFFYFQKKYVKFNLGEQDILILSALPEKTLSKCLESASYTQRIEYFRNISDTVSYLHLVKQYVVKTLNPSSIFVKDNKAYINNYSLCNEGNYEKIV